MTVSWWPWSRPTREPEKRPRNDTWSAPEPWRPSGPVHIASDHMGSDTLCGRRREDLRTSEPDGAMCNPWIRTATASDKLSDRMWLDNSVKIATCTACRNKFAEVTANWYVEKGA